jgi:uncharacterized protein DUF1559
MPTNRPQPGTTEYTHTRRRQWGCVGILLGLIVVLLLTTAYLCLFRSVPLRISKETTYITEPLKSNGKEVDYFAAWERVTYPEDLATPKNGYRLLVERIGFAPNMKPQACEQIRTKLGLAAADLESDLTCQEPYGAIVEYIDGEDFDESLIERLTNKEEPSEPSVGDEGGSDVQAMAEDPEDQGWDEESYYDEFEYDEDESWPVDPLDVLDDRMQRPWTLDDLPFMEAWLKNNDPAINLICEAVGKPTFHIPLAIDDENQLLLSIPLQEVGRVRSFARMLSARANYRIGTGDIDGAIQDILACNQLGRHMGQQGYVIPLLVGIASEGIADGIGIAGSLEHVPTKEQLQRLIDGMDRLRPPAAFESVLLVERYITLDVVQDTAHGRSSLNEWDLAVHLPSRFGIDWNAFAARVNDQCNALLEAQEFPIPYARPWDMFLLPSRSKRMAGEFGYFWLSGLESAHEASRRRTCSERLRRISLAMLLFACDHGTLPPAYSTDRDGDPLHSWRVLLLPYLGQQELYDKIRLDEPWDSERNRQFHDKAVAFYECPSAGLSPGETTYSVVVGPDTGFQPGEGKRLTDFGAGSAGLALVVEQSVPSCWMDPTLEVAQTIAEMGINLDEEPIAGLGSNHPGGCNFGFRDGAVRFVSETVDIEFLHQLLRGTATELP